ncbi:MAG: hypothetical protein ABL971_14300 [Vicinamibacterales bacterium]
MRKTLAIVFISLGVPTAPLFAQEAGGPSVLNDVAMVVATADLAPAPSSPTTAARFGSLRGAIAREAARPRQSGAPAPSSQPVTSRSWVARHPVKAGLWIGAASGAVVGAVSCENAPELVGLCMAGGLGAGAGAGAYGGVIASAISDKRRGQALSTKTKVGLVAGAAGLIVIGSSTGWTFTW